MATLGWIRETLESRRVPFLELHHPRSFTAQGLAHRQHVSGRRVAKAVVVVADGRFVLAVVPASRHVDLGKLGAALGARQTRLATESEMRERFPDCEVGAEPPLPHWPQIELWMDESMRTAGDIVFAGGTHQDGIRLRFEDWLNLAHPREGSFSAH